VQRAHVVVATLQRVHHTTKAAFQRKIGATEVRRFPFAKNTKKNEKNNVKEDHKVLGGDGACNISRVSQSRKEERGRGVSRGIILNYLEEINLK